MNSEEIIKFVEEHPEYFEGADDSRLLRSDIRSIFEKYAQALDPAEYAELKQKVEDFRKGEKIRLQAEIDVLIGEREKEELKLKEIVGELMAFEKEIHKLEKQIAALLNNNENPLSELNGKSWYNSGYMFLALDFLGVSFLYVGIILNERLTMSYVIMGIISIVLGFLLQQKTPRASDLENQPTDQMRADLSQRKDQISQISKIKHVTLANRKKVALGRINELNQKIDLNLLRINEYYRE